MMEQRCSTPPPIEPLTDFASRPLWSVMIPVYNPSAGYFREALQSVMCQDTGAQSMQISVVDNCSDDDVSEQVVREFGNGRIEFFRHPTNVGAIENFNTCIRRARGYWIHILHADDAVLPGFYARANAAIAQHPHADALTMRTIVIDERGNRTGLTQLERETAGILGRDFTERLLADQRIQFSAMVVRRSIYEELGGFRQDLPHSADWDMWKRIVVHRPIHYDPEPLVCYRLHSASLTHELMKSGRNVADERRSIEIALSYVRPRDRARVRRNSSKAVAARAVRDARSLLVIREYAVARRQLREAIRTSIAPTVLGRIVCVLAWVALQRMAASFHRKPPFRAQSGSDVPNVTLEGGRWILER